MMKKAQTATEYMIILAVVIIIALIVVGVMGGIPGIGSGAKGKTSAAYWQTSDIGIPSYAFISATGTDSKMIIKNNLPTPITITAIDISENGYSAADNALYSDSTGTVLGPGEQKTFTADMDSSQPCNSLSAGDSYSIKVKITYRESATGATYEFSGDGNLLEGQCASTLS